MNKLFHRNKAHYGHTSTIVLDDGNGLVSVTIMNGREDMAVIHDLIVMKNKRGEGLGRALLEEACAEAAGLGAKTVRLSVAPGSWLEEWYKRHGFQEIGEVEYDGLFVVLEKKCGEE